MVVSMMSEAEVQELIDTGALRIRPLLTRCQCGKVISTNKRFCNACMNAEMAKL